jgi:hypothetical protein
MKDIGDDVEEGWTMPRRERDDDEQPEEIGGNRYSGDTYSP